MQHGVHVGVVMPWPWGGHREAHVGVVKEVGLAEADTLVVPKFDLEEGVLR